MTPRQPPPGYQRPPRKPVPWMGIGSIILILFIGLRAGIQPASNP